MLEGTITAAIVSYLLMVAAFYWHRIRSFHISAMLACMVFDLSMPIYLVLHRDWKTRLIDHGDILSFGVWMHFGLIIALFVLYAIQIQTGLHIMRPPQDGEDNARTAHRAQAKGILLVRALVIATGAMLVNHQS